MKTKPQFALIGVCLIMSSFIIPLQAQRVPSILINEFSIGNTHNFIELLITGNPQRPNERSAFQDWIIDNNSVELPNDLGMLRLGSCFTYLPVKATVLIYDDQSIHPKINPANDGWPNAMGIYQIPFNDACLLKCSKQASFQCQQMPLNLTQWTQIFDLDDQQDVLQIRTNTGELEHAISWAGEFFADEFHERTVNIAPVDIPSQNTAVGAGLVEGGGGTIEDPCSAISFPVGVGAATPGEPNSPTNGNMITTLDELNLVTIRCSVSFDPNQENSTLTIDIEGGEAPYWVHWASNQIAGDAMEDDNQFKLGGLWPMTLTIEVEDARGCSHSCEVAIKSRENEEICQGSCKMIGVTDKGYCYRWTPAEGLTDLDGPMTNACPTQSTTYELKIIDDGEIIETREFHIELTELEAGFMPEEPVMCDNKPFYLFAKAWPIDRVYTYNWSTGETDSKQWVTSPGIYSVTITRDDGCFTSIEAEVQDQ